jgi:hypothetical protein
MYLEKPTTIIGCFPLGVKATIKNAVKTAQTHKFILDKVLFNCNSQVKKGYEWKEVIK